MNSFLHFLWTFFNRIPECPLKMRLRFFMAFSPFVPQSIRRMSPVLASSYKHAPQPGDIVVEGGAFPGDFTIFASKKVGPQGHVYAFEPNPSNYSHLKRHVAAFHCTNVTLIPKGLWSHDCEKKMAGRGVESHLQGNGTIDVKLASIDSEMSRLGVSKVDFIKMDIEGAEPEALTGAAKILGSNSVKMAIASYHDFEGHETRTGIEKILAPKGYKFVVDFPERQNLYAWKE
jgi:FkbM family methyltransferase